MNTLPEISELLPGRDRVMEEQGIPADAAVSPRIEEIYEKALKDFQNTVRPAQKTLEVDRDIFRTVVQGEGRNAAKHPVEQIYHRADRLVLFACTLGEEVGKRIGKHFQTNDFARGAMLDTLTSLAADRMSERLAGRVTLKSAGKDPGGRKTRAMAYSPGYCGWDISGQKALLRAVGAEQIGITLNRSFLMHPLKSVSGVVICGSPAIHRFTPDYPFCEECASRSCLKRMRALSGGSGGGKEGMWGS